MTSRKTPPGLIAAAILIFCLIAGVFYVAPMRKDLDVLRQDLLSKKSVLDQDVAELARLKQLDASLPKSEIEKQKYLNAVPIGMRQDEIILDFERLAKENQIIFDSLSFGMGSFSDFGDSVKALTISSAFRGTHKTLVSFLEALESNPRKIVVNSISVSSEGVSETAVDLVVSFSLSMEAFYQK